MQRISHFRIVSKIGEGGMGVVYQAEDLKLRRTVALKVLPDAYVKDPARRARFLREAQAAAAVSHPALCAIYEIGEEGAVVYIAMELVQGQTLRARLRGRPLPLTEAIRIGTEIAEGLARAHAAGVVHRDLKPDNVLVQPDGHVKILDFGLAKRTSDAGPLGPESISGLDTRETFLTREGTVLGTLGYMSPEQARGEPVDARSDLFALGVVLYEMTTGKNPFRGNTAADTLSAILRDRPAPLGDVNPEAPPELAFVVDKLLAKEPAHRHGSAGEVVADLRRLASDEQSVTLVASGSGASERRARSIAVLPFADMSAAKDQDYLCEGMAEELINALAKVPGLRVAARTSAFQFRGKAADVRRIGQELRVDSVLEGSVRKSGSKLRVSAQLVGAADGYQLWSERFDREMQDVFALQDELAATIVQALRVQLSADGAPPPRIRRYTENLAAYHAYLQGRYAWFNRYAGGLQKAIAAFEQAIALDPGYTLAYAGLADCYSVMGMYGFLPPRVAFPRAKEAVAAALALDTTVAEVHSAQGFVRLYFDWEWAASEQAFRRALELNPDYVQAWSWYALLLSYLKRHDEAIAAASRATGLDPLSHYAHAIAGQAFKYAGRYAEAREAARRALAQDADFVLALFTLGQAETLLGRHAEGEAALARVVALTRRDPFFLGLMAWSLGLAGRGAEAAAIRDELEQRAARSQVAPFSLALAQLACGGAEPALERLEQAYEERDSFLNSVGVDAMFARLHGHPRFAALLLRLGLPGPD